MERREAKVIEVAQLFWAVAMVEFHEEELGLGLELAVEMMRRHGDETTGKSCPVVQVEY